MALPNIGTRVYLDSGVSGRVTTYTTHKAHVTAAEPIQTYAILELDYEHQGWLETPTTRAGSERLHISTLLVNVENFVS